MNETTLFFEGLSARKHLVPNKDPLDVVVTTG